MQIKPDGQRIEHFPNGLLSEDRVNNVERVRFELSDGDSWVATVKAAHLDESHAKFSLAVVHGCLNHRLRYAKSAAGSRSRHLPLLSWIIGFGSIPLLLLSYLL